MKAHYTGVNIAFRQDRSTEHQIISQALEDAFQDKRHTLAVWTDLKKAFGKCGKRV